MYAPQNIQLDVGAQFQGNISSSRSFECPRAMASRVGEIADFNVRQGSRINTDEPPLVIHQTPDGGLIYGRSSFAMMSRVLNRRMIERSYFVSLRTRAGSDETVLSGGLTLDCAEGLQRDLREALSTNAKVSIGGVA